ncbi:MAG TPA: acetyl-CoA carboxylase, carboxyltransferase subunit beta [Chloroflexota bacterium]|nr:acetyl-CoA carboxylase, carboxyltransferase subunit beta [Chloroflexota bacterium]
MREFLRRRPLHLPLPFGDNSHAEQLGQLWIRCPSCNEQLYAKEYEDNLKVCPKCRFHFRLSSRERLDLLLDPNSFEELDHDLRGVDPLSFRSEGQAYADKIPAYERKAGTPEALVYGLGAIEEVPIVVAANNYLFQGGSMGVAVGEKIARAIDLAVSRRLPFVSVVATGGARQQEGVFALMQMAKTTAALARLGRVGMPYISLLTDPTVGGVPASYAMLGDITIAEPGAFIGFAGPRVIQEAIRQKLPAGTATSESMLAHGMIDMICARGELRSIIGRLLRLLANGPCRRITAHEWGEPRPEAELSGVGEGLGLAD